MMLTHGPAIEETDHSTPREKSLNVALSGGGLRATFFAFGAILYLLDSQDARRIAAISSVSGGSIANGVLADSNGFGNSEASDATRERIARATWILSQRGAIFAPTLAKIFLVSIVSALALSGFVALLPLIVLSVTGYSNSIPDVYTLAFPALLIAVSLTVIYTLLAIPLASWIPRKSSQISAYERTVRYAATGRTQNGSRSQKTQTQPVIQKRLHTLNSTGVSHVFCATELLSGQPVFMSNHLIDSPVFGSGPATMRLSHAIYASAAFPAVFPPLSVSTRSWRGMGDQATRPPRLFLSDGGVFNNLATDWFDTNTPGGSGATNAPSPANADYLVVNASKPGRIKSRRSWIYGLHLPALWRAMVVMQENTVRPRISLLKGEEGTAIVDISETPFALLERLMTHSDRYVKLRASRVASWLHEGRRENHWTNLASESATVPTQLERVAPTRAIHLLRHGYMNTAVAMSCLFGSYFTPQSGARGEEWFANLVESGAPKKLKHRRAALVQATSDPATIS